MGKVSEIRNALKQGVTEQALINRGYNKATIKRTIWELKQVQQMPKPTQLNQEPELHTTSAEAAQDIESMSAEDVKRIAAELEQLIEVVNEQRHAPGLCNAIGCHPCVTSKRSIGAKVAEQTRDRFIGDLTAACEWGGDTEMLRDLSDIHEKWIDAGKPKPMPKPVIEPTARGLRVDGLLIIP